MGERIVRNDEVAGSIPVISTTIKKIALILENVSKLFVLNFVYVSLTN